MKPYNNYQVGRFTYKCYICNVTFIHNTDKMLC